MECKSGRRVVIASVTLTPRNFQMRSEKTSPAEDVFAGVVSATDDADSRRPEMHTTFSKTSEEQAWKRHA
jgi:hypothetical protein